MKRRTFLSSLAAAAVSPFAKWLPKPKEAVKLSPLSIYAERGTYTLPPLRDGEWIEMVDVFVPCSDGGHRIVYQGPLDGSGQYFGGDTGQFHVLNFMPLTPEATA